MKRHHFNLRTKLVVYFILIFVVPIIGFGFLLFALQQRNAEQFIVQSQETNVLQLADRIGQELRSIQSVSNLFYLDDELIACLSADDADRSAELYNQLDRLDRVFSSGLGTVNVDIAILDRDGNYITNGPTIRRPSAQQLDELVRRPGNLSGFTPDNFESGTATPGLLYAYRPLHDRSTWKQVGALLICVKENELRKIYTGYLSEAQNAYLIDSQGSIVSSVDNQGVTYAIPSQILPLHSGTFQDRADGVPQLVSFYTVKTAGLQLVLASDLSVLRSAYRQTTLIFLGVLVLYVLLALAATWIVPRNFVRPIHELQANIDLVKQGNLDITVPVTSSDEIGQLSERYNEMLGRVRELLAGLMEAQQSQHKAEMHALQAQINPHFIYNSLASIRFLVFSQQNEAADQALIALISILRGTLSNPHEFSTVGQELKLLQDYIALQRVSFSRALHVEFRVDDSVRSCKICKLTLQPIVENAFLHGFAGGQVNCALQISARDLDGRVEITIRDNGCGFDPDAPKQAEQDGNLPHTGLGVANVHERLQLAFGPEFGLRTESAPGAGTAVTVVIPKLQTQGGAMVYDHTDS